LIDDLVDDLVVLLDRLGVPHARLVGLSLSGITAMRTAIRYPERVQRLALLCTAAQLPPADAWMERAAAVREQGSRAVTAAVVQRWFTPAHLRSRPDARAYYEQMISSR
jgi:3-oxoadipate enol-lactonase